MEGCDNSGVKSHGICLLDEIRIAAFGMLGTIITGMAIYAYGPICDNVGCIAEMAAMSHRCRKRTDVIDAAGNTTVYVT
nr:pyrophosphatase [Tanacetum cinerariifolium]